MKWNYILCFRVSGGGGFIYLYLYFCCFFLSVSRQTGCFHLCNIQIQGIIVRYLCRFEYIYIRIGVGYKYIYSIGVIYV